MNLTYELVEGGYFILKDKQRWMAQGGEYGNYFPYAVFNADDTINIEESAKAHIKGILEESEHFKEIEDDRQAQLDRIDANTTYLVMMSE